MPCIRALAPDPTTAVTKSTAATSAMAAIDTGLLRIPFKTPSSAKALVKLQFTVHGGTAVPQLLVGVMQGSSVLRRVAPLATVKGALSATSHVVHVAEFTIEVATPDVDVVWDAAFAVQVGATGTAIKFGGANVAAGGAFGAFEFGVWDA